MDYNKIYIRVLGMTCNHCKHKIITNISKIEGISNVKVDIDKNLVIFEKNFLFNIDEVIKNVTDLGYQTNISMVFESEKDFNNYKKNQILDILFVFLGFIVLYLFIKKMFGLDLLYMIPTIDNSISFSLLFVIGLMTSIHCVGMCGAFNLAASFGIKTKKTYIRPLLYNSGRVLSYTITGGIAGLLGNVLAPSIYMQGILVGLGSIFMLIIGLSMLGIISKRLLSLLPKSSKLSKIKTSSPFLIGLLNGLMPCGPLQAMQLYAISTASFFLGAMSMFLFSLGTVPLMLLVGLVFNSVKGKHIFTMQRISAVLVILLSFVMLTRAMGYLGINISLDNSSYKTAEIIDDYQYVEIDVKRNSYQKIVVQKDIEVRFNLVAEEGDLNGCNNPIIIPVYEIEKRLFIGDNIVTFTPTKTGTVSYSCWMSMIKSQIIVVDDISVEISEK